jgi:signal recognition particle subunit SRP54
LDDEDGSLKLRRMVYIFDSMTAAELDSDGKIFVEQPSRMVRIACGSGTTVREVEDLLSQHRMMAGMAKRVGGQKKQMQRAQNMLKGGNKEQQLAAMQKRMAAMGGAGAGGLPGMGDMAKMMQMLQGQGGGGMPGLGGMDLQSMMSQMSGLMGGGGGGGRGRGR